MVVWQEDARPATRRREVRVGGRRAKTIDVHAHCVIPEAQALLGQSPRAIRGPGIDEVGSRRIREMDEQGIDVEVLSINPTWYTAGRDVAAQVIRFRTRGSPSFAQPIQT